MDSLEDLKMSLLNFNFVMIYIFHKMLVLPKNHLNYHKDSIFKWFLKNSEVVFDYVHSLYYKSRKINPNCVESCIDSPEWIKKATINPINKKVINAFNML